MLRPLVLLAAVLSFAASVCEAAPVISEIMYHPSGTPEDEEKEWIEVHNNSAAPLDLSHAKITSGIRFTFPPSTTLAPGAYLVIAADLATFQAAYPLVTNVIGDWEGRLSNTGERVRIENSGGDVIADVEYADEGDWATRVRGPLDSLHKGWVWASPADGGGSSLELRNAVLTASGSGQNWGSSLVQGGTPGQPNSIATSEAAPLITEVQHTPPVPRSTDTIRFSARLWDESPGAVATLQWRPDGGAWRSEVMSDSDGDGTVEATIPPQANLTIIEFYVTASDGINTRTWPAPARTSDQGVQPETFDQTVNALLQVDDSFSASASFVSPGSQPLYRFVMTEEENQELTIIQTQNSHSRSEAEMNATFISQDGTGVKVRYLTGIRNRGFSSRLPPLGNPTSHNYHISFRSDDLWEGRRGLQFNCVYPHSQALGALLMDRAGIAPQSAAIVRLRVNGVNLAATGALQYGRYVRIEPLNGEWVERHFPNDPDGNLYRLDDHEPNPVGVIPGDLGSGEFRFEGTNPAAYADTFIKRTNEEINDWSDLIELSRVVSAPILGGTAAQPAILNDQYIASVASRLNLDQIYTFIATDALIGNQEGGLQSGRSDDAAMYRGVLDPRFILIPHDLDDVFDLGTAAGNPVTRSIFSYEGNQGLVRLFNHPALLPRYYAKVLEQMNLWFNRTTVDPLVDQVMAGWVPGTVISSVKSYVDQRRANVLNQIQQTYSLVAVTSGGEVDGIKSAPDGVATLGGTFNVAKTYSVTVNGALAQWFYRTGGGNTAGTWRFAVTPGSGFLKPGINRITVRFHDGLAGTGNVIKSLTTSIYRPAVGTEIAGTLAPTGSVSLLAPSTYVPGVPFVVRVDIRNANGDLDRAAWDRVATLTASNGVTLTPNTVRLFNGIGSAVVVASSGGTAANSNFTITANVFGSVATKALTSLSGQPQTNVSGPLSGDSTWSGIVNVTGDVTVPPGVTLTIEPGTHVLMAGTSGAGDSTGADLVVRGRLVAIGDAANPISVTASDPAARWGQIFLNGAQPSTLRHVLLSHAGHAPGQGHTNRGPMLLLNGASVTLESSVLTRGPAKAIYSNGTCNVVIRNSLISQMITGPELGNGCSLLLEDSNIQEILPEYRESNAAMPDDEDCLYVHNSAGRSVVVRRAVLALCGDDLFDCLGGPITVEDSILRDGWDKGISLLNNDLTITRSRIIGCDKAIVPKSSTVATRTVNVDRCTIVCENHDTSLAPWDYPIPPTDPDSDTPSTGLYTQYKSGQSVVGAVLAISARNSIIIAQEPILVDAPYAASRTVVNFSLLRDSDTANAPLWQFGTNNSSADPLFRNESDRDYHLTAISPCLDSGDPASHPDPDGSVADIGALAFAQNSRQPRLEVWTPGGGPYHVTDHLVIPPDVTLQIQGGTSIYVAQNKRITVNGVIKVEGTPDARVVFSHLPGSVATGDADPIKNGVQTGPPKWAGLRVVDSMAQENVIRYADFINAQGTDPTTSENWGSLGFIRSWGFVQGCTWSGTHLRMCYGRNAKLTVRECIFPDMFLHDPVLQRIENPTEFLPSCDNQQEHLKVEYPTTDEELQGHTGFSNGFPVGGWFRVYHNDFYGNRGHNDVLDADSGRWGQAGSIILDCRYNLFHGLTGDEHIDLGGDAYIASNVFERGAKDEWTSDTGYSSAISSGDRGPNTTIIVARNLFLDLDHAINLKTGAGSIFEHNTVANLHPDFVYSGTAFGTPFTQNVKCSVVNVFIPEDGFNPTRGDGAYFGYNLISNVPRLLSGADTRKVGSSLVNDVTTRVQFSHNLLDQIADPTIGANHLGGIFNPAYGSNQAGEPGFVAAEQKNYNLRLSSAARAAAPGDLDYGFTVPEWAYILGGPADVTRSRSATFLIGGPGLVSYKWRLNSGPWSSPIQIGAGGVFPRETATVRQAVLVLSDLPNGPQKLEVLGQDMAGNWQHADPARSDDEQFGATVREWTVDPLHQSIRINECLSDGGSQPDWVELHNTGEQPVNIGGWFLTDNLAEPTKVIIPTGVTIPGGGYHLVMGLALDRDGDEIHLLQGTKLIDSVSFGPQVTALTIGRMGSSGAWALCQPTPGAANLRQLLGETTALRINEWFTSGNVLYDEDWIELANTSALPIALAGLKLTDNRAGDRDAHQIAPLSFIGANGFLKFIADGEPSRGPTHLSFALDAEQEQIALYDGATELDVVLFFPQATDYSMGRDPNSPSGYRFYELPTGGIANIVDSSEYLNALAILRGLRITELMYNPVGSQDYEFVELRNVGSVPLDLTGVRLVEGITFTFGALSLDPGANVILVSNLGLFRERYGNAPRVGGTFSGRLDNSGETLALRLPPPYDANVLTFSYQVTWQPAASGRGKSLVVANASTQAGAWGSSSTWTYSASVGGDPDGVMIAAPDHFLPWLGFYARPNADDDSDHDGVSALVEYALAMNPTRGNEGNGAEGLPSPLLNTEGALELHFEVPENLSAVQSHGRDDIRYLIEASDDLATWTPIATKVRGEAWSGAASVTLGPAVDGLVPVVVRDPDSAKPVRYLRLRTTLLP